MTIASLMLVAAIVIVLLAGVAIYNRLVALTRRCDQAGSDIDVQLRLRHDLIPNLVETVKGYATHERETLEAVTKARAAAVAATPGPEQMKAEAAFSGAIGRLMAVAEAFPDLKASANFAALQGELADVENKIAASRRFLNSAINEYNTAREQFPANLIAGRFGFAARELAALDPEERARLTTAPSVRF